MVKVGNRALLPSAPPGLGSPVPPRNPYYCQREETGSDRRIEIMPEINRPENAFSAAYFFFFPFDKAFGTELYLPLMIASYFARHQEFFLAV